MCMGCHSNSSNQGLTVAWLGQAWHWPPEAGMAVSQAGSPRWLSEGPRSWPGLPRRGGLRARCPSEAGGPRVAAASAAGDFHVTGATARAQWAPGLPGAPPLLLWFPSAPHRPFCLVYSLDRPPTPLRAHSCSRSLGFGARRSDATARGLEVH